MPKRTTRTKRMAQAFGRGYRKVANNPGITLGLVIGLFCALAVVAVRSEDTRDVTNRIVQESPCTADPITVWTTPLTWSRFEPGGPPSPHSHTHGPGSSDPLPPLSNWVENWTAVSSFTNSWVNFGSGYNDAAYYKDPFGIVHLRGLVKSGTIGTGIFTLPSGYRPPNIQVHAIASNAAFGYIDISTAGVVRPLSPSNNAWVSLDGITFRV